jgi:HAD superfamily hydrolase (TIGR01549 family)
MAMNGPQVQAIVFDLDGTLLDTSCVDVPRSVGDWRGVRDAWRGVGEFEPAEGALTPAQAARTLAGRGVQIGVLTKSPQWYATELLKRFAIPYEALVTGSDQLAKKPETAALVAISKLLGLAADQVVFIGNDSDDHEAAAAAGGLAIGVEWEARPRPDWRRHWPDISLASADLLLDLDVDLGLLAEAVLMGKEPRWHYGTLARPAQGVWCCGRYFATADISRHHQHPLSELVLEAKDGAEAAARVGELMARAAAAPHWQTDRPGLVVSVPPQADQWDRFADIRAMVAAGFGARDGPGCVQMLREVDNYKRLSPAERARANQDRWAACDVGGEHVLLLDDTYAHGETTGAVANALRAAGAVQVDVLALAVAQEPQAEQCPSCGGRLKARTGPYGPFIGCGNYPGCRYTRNY